jgi:hypothetical protein
MEMSKKQLKPIETKNVGCGTYAAGETALIIRFVEAIPSPLGCVVTFSEDVRLQDTITAPYLVGPPIPSVSRSVFMPGATLEDVRKAFFED